MKRYKIVENKRIWFSLSLGIIALGLIFMITHGFNWGIDFIGGNILHLDIHQSYGLAEIRNTIGELDIKEFEAKRAGDTGQELIIRTVELTKEMQTTVLETLKHKWPKTELVRSETIDAVIGKELQKQAVIALIIANIGMLLYITVRFEFGSAIAAVLALGHDILVVLSFYTIFNIPIDSIYSRDFNYSGLLY